MKLLRIKNPVWILLFTFVMGVVVTLTVLRAVQPKGDIDPIELDPPSAPDCWHLYDNSNHAEWSKCMGVEYRSNWQSRNRRGAVMRKEGEITRVISDFVFFDTVKQLRHDLATKGKCTDCGDTMGISHCKRDLEANVAECLILTVRPKRVDDGPTTVLGHEVEHGIYGRFHK